MDRATKFFAVVLWLGFIIGYLPGCPAVCQPGEKPCPACERCEVPKDQGSIWLEACAHACGSHGMLMGDYTHTNCVCLGIVSGPPLSPEQR